MAKRIRLFTIFSTVGLLLFGCGSGSSVTLPQQQKTATVIFSAANTALTTPVSALEISAKMPIGVNVRLKAGTTNEVDAASLIPRLIGSSVTGSYSSVTRDVTLIVLPGVLPTNWGTTGSIGVFAEIKVDCQQDITKASFISINSSFPGFKASNGTTDNPTGLLIPSMDVTF